MEFLKWSVLKGKRQWCQPPRTALHFNHDDGDGDGDQGCINCGILLSGIRACGEHGDVFLFSNLGAL